MPDSLIGWVQPMLRQWSKYVLTPDTGYPTISVLGRIKEQGLVGSYIKSPNNQGLIVKEMPVEIKKLHKTVEQLPKDLQQVVVARYLLPGSDSYKARSMGLSRQRYYSWLSRAHVWIAARLSP